MSLQTRPTYVQNIFIIMTCTHSQAPPGFVRGTLHAHGVQRNNANARAVGEGEERAQDGIFNLIKQQQQRPLQTYPLLTGPALPRRSKV